MTEAPVKRRPGRPRKLPQSDPAAAPAPVAPPAQTAPAGLSAAPVAHPEPQPIPVASPPAPVEVMREEPRAADIRADLRGEDPRAEAERIAAEWFGHLDSLGPHKDKYYVDPTKIPDAWSYEWRTYTVVGKENPQYQVQLQRSRWRPVPARRHPELMPSGYDPNGAILIDGMMLMERPKAITDYQKARDKAEADAPIKNIRDKLTGAPPSHFPRGVGGAPAAVNTAFAPPDIPAKPA